MNISKEILVVGQSEYNYNDGPLEQSTKNALIIGSTGNFKSSGILIPSIYKMRGHSSLIITDFSGELLSKTSGALIESGYEIVFHPVLRPILNTPTVTAAILEGLIP